MSAQTLGQCVEMEQELDPSYTNIPTKILITRDSSEDQFVTTSDTLSSAIEAHLLNPEACSKNDKGQ